MNVAQSSQAMKAPLCDQPILITRPAHKQTAMADLLQAEGAQAINFATIDIQPISPPDDDYNLLKQHILDLDLFDIIICVSANAARLAVEIIDQYWPQMPIGIKWLAIGDATATALAILDIDASTAQRGSDSEALLEHAFLQQVAGKKILILKGNSGRELLSQTLRTRKAIISEAHLYNRLIPVYTDLQIQNALYHSRLSAILVTSGEALSNLHKIAQGSLTQSHLNALQATMLIVPSTRVAELASTQGYQRVTVAAAADDQSMLTALLTVKSLEADNEKKK